MDKYQEDFIKFCLEFEALRFGEFTLKSGRTSPYFFNAGQFKTGEAMMKLGEAYADAILQSGVEFDMIFGPAYKGIPLATTTAIALARKGRDVPFCFNRKEKKDHGEGGSIVGAPLKGRVLVVDDVITAGTAIRESVQILKGSAECKLAGVVISLDRQEKAPNSDLSAIQSVNKEFGVPVVSIVGMADLITFLGTEKGTENREEKLEKMKKYRKNFGVTNPALDTPTPVAKKQRVE